jgi:hypothetical protein
MGRDEQYHITGLRVRGVMAIQAGFSANSRSCRYLVSKDSLSLSPPSPPLLFYTEIRTADIQRDYINLYCPRILEETLLF